jgi:hypothetical protein
MKRVLLFWVVSSMLVPTLLQAAESPGTTLLTQGAAAITEKKFDEALGLYERVFAESNKVDEWFNAQKGIALAFAKKGEFPRALQAVRISLDGAPNLQRFDEAVQLAANLFSALDKDVKRANAFLDFQRTGTGENPMEQIDYPALPEREKVFTTTRSEAGDTPAASRVRAWTFLYTGKPKDAISHFADAFRRASATGDLQNAGSDLVLVALRNLRGQAAGIENEIAFVVSGPAGPDGQTGTADDLKDPFTGFPAPPSPGQGGVVNLPPEQLDALRKVSAAAMLYAADPRIRSEVRRDALLALQRSTDVLDNWVGQKDWYFQMALGPEGAGVEDAFLIGAQAAAKGRDLHLGGAASLWKQITDHKTAEGAAATRMERTRKQFDTLCTTLGRIRPRKLGFKPLTQPATF